MSKLLRTPRGAKRLPPGAVTQDVLPFTPQRCRAGVAGREPALDEGVIGAWYSLQDGPIGEVVFSRGTDETALRKTMAEYPGLRDQRVTMKIWGQWLGKGVLR